MSDERITITRDGQLVFEDDRHSLRALWSDTSWRMQRLRDDAACADDEHALRTELAKGAQAVVIVGTDSPTLPVRYLQEALAQLTSGAAQVVLGPASDGGYYLIGASQPVSALFADGIKWGTSSVLPTTLQRLREVQQQHPQLRCHLLPFFYDVDTPSDLRLLREHLQFSRNRGQFSDGTDALGPEISAPQTWALLCQLGLTSS